MGVSRELVRLGYLFILDREPESEQAISDHEFLPDLRALRTALIASEEGRTLLRAEVAQSRGAAADRYDSSTLCHLHIEKTGGTSLHEMLAAHFDPSRVAPPHLQRLTGMSVGDLSYFDVISAHIDYRNSLLIPRKHVRRVALFREPFDRLWSFYGFHRAHRSDPAQNYFVSLAHEFGPVDFFRHPLVVSSPRLNNAYLRTFGTTLDYSIGSEGPAGSMRDDLALAVSRIQSLDGIGLTERMEESTALIFKALDLPAPAAMLRSHRTDDLGNAGIERIIPEEVRSAMAPLVEQDQYLYTIAKSEFEFRLR